MLRELRRLLVAALALSAVTPGCGAKTGLLVPDVLDEAPMDAADVIDVPDVPDVPDVIDRPPVCQPGHFTLVARAADLILVVDRSGSMNQNLGGGRGGASKWQLLRNALAVTLPRYQDRINVGALFYPETDTTSREASCALANIPSLDIVPAVGTASAVLGTFDTTGPGGATPTAAALQRAYSYIVRTPNRARARYIAVATDGAPNCNAGLDTATCRCTGGGGGRCRAGSAINCLDDTRTVSLITQIANNPIQQVPVFVIGIADDSDPTFASTLRAMALAGGRPYRDAAGNPGYYDVRQPDDLTIAFNTIQNSIARCTFVTPSRPPTDDGISITFNGATIPHDTTRINGWDWTDRAFGEITLFGAACPAETSPNATVQATVECPDA